MVDAENFGNQEAQAVGVEAAEGIEVEAEDLAVDWESEGVESGVEDQVDPEAAAVVKIDFLVIRNLVGQVVDFILAN